MAEAQRTEKLEVPVERQLEVALRMAKAFEQQRNDSMNALAQAQAQLGEASEIVTGLRKRLRELEAAEKERDEALERIKELEGRKILVPN